MGLNSLFSYELTSVSYVVQLSTVLYLPLLQLVPASIAISSGMLGWNIEHIPALRSDLIASLCINCRL